MPSRIRVSISPISQQPRLFVPIHVQHATAPLSSIRKPAWIVVPSPRIEPSPATLTCHLVAEACLTVPEPDLGFDTRGCLDLKGVSLTITVNDGRLRRGLKHRTSLSYDAKLCRVICAPSNDMRACLRRLGEFNNRGSRSIRSMPYLRNTLESCGFCLQGSQCSQITNYAISPPWT